MKEVSITVRDGTRIGAAIYAPEDNGKYPVRHLDRAERVPVQEGQPHPPRGRERHYYQPDKIGQDTIFHSSKRPSALILPVHD